MTDETVSFHVEKEKNNRTKEILKEVYNALEEKGDPTYITSHKNARNLIREVERDELLDKMVKAYIGLDE